MKTNNPNTYWYIYFDENLNKRLIVHEFRANSRKEAEKVFSEFVRTSNDELKDNFKLDNRETSWWRVYDYKNDNRITLHVYSAKNRDEAYRKFVDFIKTLKDKNGLKLYYGDAFKVLSKDKTYKYVSRHLFCSEYGSKENHDINEYRKGYKAGKKDVEFKYNTEVPYYIKTGHSITEWYNLPYHIINDLLFNIPILLEKMNGYPAEYTKKAADKVGVKLGEYHSPENPKDWDKISPIAIKMWKEEVSKFLEHLRLYSFYSDHGIIDPTVKGMKEIEKKYKDSIPYFKGTLDIDYEKLSPMIEKEWNFVTDWMKKNLLKLWD